MVYNLLQVIWSYLRAGVSKTSFGEHVLDKLPNEKKRKQIKSFQAVFDLKLETHSDSHPAYPHYNCHEVSIS